MTVLLPPETRGRVSFGVEVAMARGDAERAPVAASPPDARPDTETDFAQFYAATNRQATAQVFAMVGNWHEAQEAVQEAYARALGRWDKVSTYDEPLAWIRTVAYRIAVSRWRKARRLVFGGPEDRAVVPTPMENHVALVAALQQLPAAQREALVLHYLGDLPIAQIAAQLGVPEGTVKARLSRGRVAMAKFLKEDDGV